MPAPGSTGPTPLFRLYRLATRALVPVVWAVVSRKLARHGVEPQRMHERLGHASLPRPASRPIWFHAASVGESLSVLALIARLGLAGKVGVDADGKLRHTALSAGQRRRVALLQVYLDRKPVIVLDEWAAEQDPVFRRFFYETLLPELRDRGSTVILVTHDDRYFDCADRLIEIGAPGRRPAPDVRRCIAA